MPLLAAALLSVPAHAQNLVQRWANTTITLGSGNNGLGYSPVSGNVIASVCSSATAGSATIYQLKFSDGTSAGANLSVPSALIAGGTFVIGGLTVGSDGVIYACNYGAVGATRIYKWANEGATPTQLGANFTLGAGSMGKNLTVYGSGNNAVFLVTSTTTGPLYIYFDTGTSTWTAKQLAVSSGSCVTSMAFINWSPISCTFASKNSSANGYRSVFNPSSASPIAVTQTAVSGTGWASGAGTIQNVAYDPVTGLYGTHTRDNGASPFTHTINTWATGGSGTSGTIIAPVAQTALTRNSSAADGGASGACCWATNTGVFLDIPAVAGFGLVAYDTTAYKMTDTTPAGPVQVSSGRSQTFSVASGGSQLSYQWQVNKGSGYANVSGSEYSGANSATLTINPTAVGDSGTYRCVVTGVSSSTWTSTGAALTVCTAPTSETVSGSATICNGGSATVTMDSSQSGVIYQLYAGASPSGSTVAGDGTMKTWTVSPTSTTTYTVQATTAGGYCSTTMGGNAVVTVNPLPTAYSVTGGGSYCAGGSGVPIGLDNSQTGKNYQLYGNGGATAVGSPVAGTGNAISFGNQTIADTYTVVATDTTTSCMASMTGSATVTVNPPPTVAITPSGSTTLCSGSSVGLIASGASTYSWAPGTGLSSTTGASVMASPTATTTYTVTATDVNGCGMTARVTVTVNPLPTVAITPSGSTTFCSGGSVGFNAGGASTYSWAPETGLSATTGASVTASPTATTTYTLTGTDVNGCVNTAAVTVTVNSVPSPATPTVNSPVCSGSAANFSVAATGGDLTYAWRKLGSGWGSGNQWQLVSGANSGFFIYTSSANGNGSSGNIDTSGKSWGMYANSGDTASAVRALGAGLSVGQTIQLDMDNGWIDSGTVGIGLQNSTGDSVWEFYFHGGDSYYTINDSAGPTPTTIGFTADGLRIAFTLTSASTYSVTITTPLGGTTYGPFTGSLINPAGGQAITQLRLYNDDAGSFSSHDAYFNSIVLGAYDDNAGNYTAWNNGDNFGNGPITGATSSTYTINPASTSDSGSYDVFIQNTCGQSTSSSVSLTVNPLPTVAITPSGSTTICSGSSVGLTASGASTYSWSPGTGLSATTGASVTASPMATTIYTVTGTDVNGCLNTAAVTVTVDPLPTVGVNSTAICPGGSAVLTATTSASSPSYLWNDPASSTTASITVSPASTTTYTVTVTDGVTGCVNNGSGTVTVNPLPTASVNSATVCFGGSAPLTATTGAANPSYLWSPGGATTASITVSPASTTTYTVTVTDGVTGCINSGSGTVTVNPAPTLTTDTTNQTACAGSEVMWSVVASGTGLSYQWQRDGTNLLEGVESFTGTAAATLTNSAVAAQDGVDAAHGYACVVSIGTCSVTSTLVSLTVNPLPAVSVNSPTICEGGSAVLTAATSASTPSYLWSPGEATTASITVSPASTTTYTVTVTDGTTGCANSGSGTATVNPLPTLSVNSQTICAGGYATLTATTGASSPSYLWTDPAGSTTASITVSPAATTTYTVTVTDGTTGCANSGNGTVTVNPLPTVSVNSAIVCAGGSATLTATTSASTPSYLWSPGGATAASITLSPATTTTYTVTVTDGTTGCNNGGSGTVTVNVAPTADAGPAQTICAGTPGGTAIGGSPTASGGTAPYSYSWTPTTGLDDATAANPKAEIGSTTTYTVTVTDANGCTAGSSVVLTVPPLPNIESTTILGTDVTLVWDSLAGQTYRVQYTTDLPDPPAAASWTDVTPDVTAAGATATYTDHAGAATQRFYRIFIVCP